MKDPNITYVKNLESSVKARNTLLVDGHWPVIRTVRASSIIAKWGMLYTNGPGLITSNMELRSKHDNNWTFIADPINTSCIWIPVWIYLLADAHVPGSPLKAFLPYPEHFMRFQLDLQLEDMQEDYQRFYVDPDSTLVLLTEYKMKEPSSRMPQSVKNLLDLSIQSVLEKVVRRAS
jgi:hypothetical protein